MQSHEIREKFLAFFEERDHLRVPSSPLVPADDPTLLFTNSGMAQFKNVFLGFDKPPHPRATTAQRCLRAGGKHNDLQNVGYTSRHHTFFEMLGNFSFGDYFKERAIPLAWEFLTSAEGLGLDKKHLWITVFGGGKIFGEKYSAVPPDEDAFNFWLNTLQKAGFSETEARQRITRIPSTDNFWMMGDTGPCGPCSEIFYDRDGAATEFRGEDEKTADDCVEVWNLVFMEFNRDDSGTLNKLPAPCVDTGMGLERISAVMQNVNSNYDIDLFQNLLGEVNAEIKKSDGEDCKGIYQPSHRVIADHIRAAAYLVADGVLPDNEGRGYVLRKIIRRALIHGSKAAKKPAFGHTPWFGNLSSCLPEVMGEAGEVLLQHRDKIHEVLEREERGFLRNFLSGHAHLTKKIHAEQERYAAAKSANFPHETKTPFSGAVAFELYDTYGFPVEATEDEVRTHGFSGVDMAEFDKCMNAQRTRSRAATKFNVGQTIASYDGAATKFIGNEKLQDYAKIVALFAHGETVQETKEGDEVLLVLDRTPFYAESGGQIGDSGFIQSKNGVAEVRDTQKIRADVHGHSAMITSGIFAAGDEVLCKVDIPRRRDIARSHSVTHLMHAALKQVLGDHVRQKGSLVAPGHLRFDFSHDSPLTDAQLYEAEQIVNEQIRANHPVKIESLSYDDAVARGATALFGEKYGDIVRMVAINPDFSMELCGGMHVERGGDIGFFQFTSEGAIAAGVRRVEAVCGARALTHAQNATTSLKQIAAALKSPPDKTLEKIAQLRESLKAAQKQADALRHTQTAAQTTALAANAKDIGGIKVVIANIDGADISLLREMATALRGAIPGGAFMLAGDGGGAASFVAASSVESVNAGKWLSAVMQIANAKGGGKPGYAQAGGGDCAKIKDVLRAAKDHLTQDAA